MAFYYFLIGVISIYIVYYLIMVVLDIIKIKKNKTNDNQGHEVNIADAVAGYKPKIASEVMMKESEEVMAEMEKANSLEEEAYSNSDNTNEEPDDFPFDMNNSEMFISSTEEDEEPESNNGGYNIQYEPVEQEKDEYPDIEMNGGYYTTHLKELVEEINGGENLFAHVKWSAAG